MSFQPILPMTGLAGWSFLSRTIGQQQAAFVKSIPVQRTTDYFRANISKATTAEALVNDRQLLQVALGAFGLDDDINARALIRKVLEGGVLRSDSLASRMSDKRYALLAEAFGYGDSGPRVGLPDFANDLIARYESHQLEPPTGRQGNDARLAHGLEAALDDLLADTQSARARWFAVIGDPPLRKIFEVALELPPNFAQFDIDKQFDTLTNGAKAVFGTDDLAEFIQTGRHEELAQRFVDRIAPRVGLPDFADDLVARYEARQFEVAIGERDNDMRLALNVESSLSDLLANTRSNRARWFTLMGDPPLRKVFETALGLPPSFAQIDVDRQLSMFMSKARTTFGTSDLADFTKDDKREDLIRRFLVRSEAAAFASQYNPANIALTLLSGMARPGG